MIPHSSQFEPNLRRRALWARVVHVGCAIMSLFGLVVLSVLIGRVWIDGSSLLTWQFLTEMPSELDPLSGGIKPAIYGTVWLIGLTALFAIPVGIAAAIYLEEYAEHNAITRFIALNIANLAGVPSVVYGILGLTLFVRWLNCGRSIMAGALTLSLLVLPVIIIASREALAAVPKTTRLAAYALGATKWQTIWHHVLPAAVPGIMTGLILAMSRAIGEAAPLIVIGAVAFMIDLPRGLFDSFQVVPITIFQAADKPGEEWHQIASASILVLLGVLLAMNAVAVTIRAIRSRT
ncbi:MAG: phosphate ABC transporter permease PstA [Phycisphaerales bacterium]|nr:phosphate ABC transporter permease PstA [Phycisphaerales bacterium]